MVNRRGHFLRADGIAGDVRAVFVGLAINRAASDATAGHDGGKTLGPVLTARGILGQDFWSSAKFTHRDN